MCSQNSLLLLLSLKSVYREDGLRQSGFIPSASSTDTLPRVLANQTVTNCVKQCKPHLQNDFAAGFVCWTQKLKGNVCLNQTPKAVIYLCDLGSADIGHVGMECAVGTSSPLLQH